MPSTYQRSETPPDGGRATPAGERAAASSRIDPDHRRLASTRAPDQPLVQVAIDPSTGRARILVVVEDMPHLIDTLICALRRRELVPTRLVHPRIAVQRSDDGRLVDGPADDRTAPADRSCELPGPVDGAVVTESWIAIDLDTLPPRSDPAELQTELTDRIRSLREHLDTEPDRIRHLRALAATVADQGSGELAEFLRWCVVGHLHLLSIEHLDHAPDPTDGAAPADRYTLAVRWHDHGSALIRGERPLRLTVTAPDPRDGAHVVVGVVSADARRADPLTIPLIGDRVRELTAELGLTPDSWSGQRALDVLANYPRTELLRSGPDTLRRVLRAVPEIVDGRQIRAVAELDDHLVSVVVFVPHDRSSPAARTIIRSVVETAVHGTVVDEHTTTIQFGAATTHLLLETGAPRADIDEAALEGRLTTLLDSWADQLAAICGPAATTHTFPPAYRAEITPADAAQHLPHLQTLTEQHPTAAAFSAPDGADDTEGSGAADHERPWRFHLYTRHDRVALSTVLPVLGSLGLHVLDETSWEVGRDDGTSDWIHRFGVRPQHSDAALVPAYLDDAFAAAWSGRTGVDRFNALVTAAALTWRQCLLLRALARYLQQIGHPHGPDYVAETLVAHPGVATLVVDAFAARFHPDLTDAQRRDRCAVLDDAVTAELDRIDAREPDRIARALLALVAASTRTNLYRRRADAEAPLDLALKLDPTLVPDCPEPRPVIETFVFATDVEGTHLRFGPVARGGLRWSDRAEDYRTEVLGLAKAQTVKNAVIVPAGAKGCFVSKSTPDDPTEHYRRFVSALLDVVDDPANPGAAASQVRYDGDDDYLVVAADKGTATFSDTANAVAAHRGYWLGDAFASGGATGYDHKKLGITSRGVWCSVRRHLREHGVDPDRDPITTVGIGDMSGDVFGNGLLADADLRLIAAFDHRHVFLDPAPDAARARAERRRLFALPRSSWADYDRDALSTDGGVWPRTAKSIPLGPAARDALGLDAGVTALDPPALIRAILRAPVTLLWNGGVGTHVKASTETHAQAGDRAGDDVRVDATQLRAAVVGEGGNLGFTARARVEYARCGGRINTDAVDNSAGVSCSDHEVNIKIAVRTAIDASRVDPAHRDELLAAMSDEVAALVLAENVDHNVVLGVARARAADMLAVHARLLTDLEARHGLNRHLDTLPDPGEIDDRRRAGEGLTSPELCTLLGRTKLALADELATSSLPDDATLPTLLPDYFPATLTDAVPDALADHPLRRRIVVSALTNRVVARAGLSYCYRLANETGADWTDAVRAYLVATAVFGLDDVQDRIGELYATLPHPVVDRLTLLARRLLDRGARWLLNHRPQPLQIGPEIERFRPGVARLAPRIGDFLRGGEADALVDRIARHSELGVPADIARRCAEALYCFPLLDITDISEGPAADLDELADLYFTLADRLDLHRLLTTISDLDRTSRADTLARGYLRDQLYGTLRALTRAVAVEHPGPSAVARVDAWEQHRVPQLHRLRTVRRDLDADTQAGAVATATAAIGQLRGLTY